MSGGLSWTVPMPIPRPSGLGEVDLPSIQSRMPLEATEKAADAFNSLAGRVVAPQDKSISWGFLEAWTTIKDYTMEMYNQFSSYAPYTSMDSVTSYTGLTVIVVLALIVCLFKFIR